MAKSNGRYNRHFILKGTARAERFQSPRRWSGGPNIPPRNREQHGSALLDQIKGLHTHAETARKAQKFAGIDEDIGLRIEFESFPDIKLALESLDRDRSGIELLNVRHGKSMMATVFVPDGQLEELERIVGEYLDESKDSKSGPKNNKLIDPIASIRAATLEALWTDQSELPDSDEEKFWWEVWLPLREDRGRTTKRFKDLAEKQGFRVALGEIEFPERTVLHVYGSSSQMKKSIQTLNTIAELRRAKETAEFFDTLPPRDQSDWIDDLLKRTESPKEGADVPHICIIDTGVNYGHPLIAMVLSDADVYTVDPNWGIRDVDGHGTGMAGLAIAGDLNEVLTSEGLILIDHRLESVKLLPENYSNYQDEIYHAYLTIEAVALPEVMVSQRRRVFSMAITSKDNRDHGRPSAWSAAIDRLASDADEYAETPRLFMISAGNAKMDTWADSPKSNKTDGIHDPAQSWNALTVGAATNLIQVEGEDTEGYQPIARVGGLSPFSTTSSIWDKQWPLKPDVVFEGGNAAKNMYGAVWMQSLSLLTTHSNPTERLLTTTNATSAASILAARMAVQIMAEYPDLWPETIRALILHSAEWTDTMRQDFLSDLQNPKKEDIIGLVRCCGFGIPDLQRAMWSIQNSLTMICEGQLHPFTLEDGQQLPSMREMHFHHLPWPSQELRNLGETPVEMRVTLSYFIEPNPSARGYSGRYCYESYGLRYDVKRPTESDREFRERINRAVRDKEGYQKTSNEDNGWMIGIRNRPKGSIHSDIWKGSAADLASRGMIGVYPTQGWWKTRPKHKCYNRMARYSLVVSIIAPDVEVDIYSAVANQIAASVVVES